jgi:GGL domain
MDIFANNLQQQRYKVEKILSHVFQLLQEVKKSQKILVIFLNHRFSRIILKLDIKRKINQKLSDRTLIKHFRLNGNYILKYFVAIFRVVTEQLRREAAIQRLPVTQAVSDIIKYVTEHEQEDCLLVGFSSQKVNPFREKSSCSIL